LFLIAALNGLDVLSADIQNAYLTAQPREKVFFVAGSEFGRDKGRIIVVVRALYGLKASGAAFRSKLSADLRELGFRPSLADPDVYLRPRESNGFDYYEIICCYVDDILVISTEPHCIMDMIKKIYTLKQCGPPSTYLGATISKFEIDGKDRRTVWGLSSANFAAESIKQLEKRLGSSIKPSRTIMSHKYRPELDISTLCSPTEQQFYQQLVGQLRWLVELGRIDLSYATSRMSSFLVNPRVGHLHELFHIFGYIKRKPSLELIFDPFVGNAPRHSSDSATKWHDFYPDAQEIIPDNAPAPRGNAVFTTVYVDADHAGDSSNRRSQTGIILLVNNAPIQWYSSRQRTVETSSHGSELVATRLAVEMAESLRYKLRMFGIPILGPTTVYVDNQSVVNNGTRPESSIKKRHNAISFHKIRESVAAGWIQIVKVGSKDNLADLLTKNLDGAHTDHICNHLLV
jgi:hypothetical protein